MPNTSQTLSYDALLSTTLQKYAPTMADNIAKDNVLMFVLRRDGGWSEVDDIGTQAVFPLMYALGSPDSYDGYDQLDTTPMDGMTVALFEWRQASVPIAISGKEEKQNRGEERVINLLDKKILQAETGFKEWFAKVLLQGLGAIDGTSVTSAYVSPSNGSTFVDPLPLLVAKDPTSSTSIGAINQSTNTWWRNQFRNGTSDTTNQLFRNALRNLYNKCSKGTGGRPNLHITDQITHELYEASLEQLVALPSYQRVDIPFDNIGFRGKPVVWDEQVPDVETPVAGNCDTKGTWFMLNTDHMGFQVHSGTNFAAGPFVKPENQDAKVAQVLLLGAMGLKNRRKQGVYFNIARTLS